MKNLLKKGVIGLTLVSSLLTSSVYGKEPLNRKETLNKLADRYGIMSAQLICSQWEVDNSKGHYVFESQVQARLADMESLWTIDQQNLYFLSTLNSLLSDQGCKELARTKIEYYGQEGVKEPVENWVKRLERLTN